MGDQLSGFQDNVNTTIKDVVTLGGIGKGDGKGGESTRQAVALAQMQANGTLPEGMVLPEGFGQINGEYIFEQTSPTSSAATNSTKAGDLQQAQADWNRINVSNPFGTSGYTVGEDGRTTLSSEFSPELQGLFGQLQGMAGGQGDKQYQDAAMTNAMGLLDPVFQNQRDELAASMVSRGLAGGEQYDKEMAAQQTREGQAYNQAAFDSIAGGAQLEQQDYQQIMGLLSGMPNSPFQGVDVMGSFGPGQNELAMMLQKQMADDANKSNERGQNIQGATNIVDSIWGG